MENVTNCSPHGRSIRPIWGMVAPALVALVLAACGRPPEAPAIPTPTPVITFPTVAPQATPVGGAGTVTATEGITATEGVTATEGLTETGAISSSEPVSGSEEISGTGALEGTNLPSAEEIQSGAAAAEEAQVAADASLFFLHPTDNAVVPLTFTLAISYTGLDLAAGKLFLLVDSPFAETGQAMPSDALHVSLRGARSAQVGITGGSHVLRLQYVGSDDVALDGDQYRQQIVINAVDGAPSQSVRIVTPTEGAIVPPTFDVVMAAAGMDVAPAGTPLAHAGHLHLILNAPFVNPGEIIPSDETHLHFGKAQLRGSVTLPPGDHLVRLQFADGQHRALEGSQYRAEVRVRVEEGAPANQVRIVKPADGATVSSPFQVVWAASGLIIEQAGQAIRPGAGHLHLLIDEEFVPGGELIPNDATHLHFGKGQTSTELTLEPGEYTLRLQMANGGHLAHEGEEYHDEITVTVR